MQTQLNDEKVIKYLELLSTDKREAAKFYSTEFTQQERREFSKLRINNPNAHKELNDE